MLYEYEHCGHALEAYRKIDDRHIGPECPTCGQTAILVIRTAPYGYVDSMKEYRSPITGEPITNRRQRRYEMEKGDGQGNDYIDANDFAQTYQQRKEAKEREQAEIRAIKDAIPAEIKNMGEQLAKEERKRMLG